MFPMDEDIVHSFKPHIQHHMIWQLMQEKMYPARRKRMHHYKDRKREDMFPPRQIIYGFDINHHDCNALMYRRPIENTPVPVGK